MMKSNTAGTFAIIFMFLCFSCKTASPEHFGGINLYTLREELKTEPKQILKDVSNIGYKNIEDAGYLVRKFYGMPPLEFKTYLGQVGLVPIASHQGGITFENADDIIADVKAVGYEYLVIPIPPMGQFTYNNETQKMGMTGGVKKLAQVLNTLGEKCDKAGLKLLYHNHDFEFYEDEEGVIPMDYLLEHTDPKLVNFEIDLYWATKAGADPFAYFETYPGRFKAWHVKDMDAQGRFAPVGKGTLDFAQYLSKKELAGMVYYFVEQDATYDGMTPIEAIAISHEALKEMGYK